MHFSNFSLEVKSMIFFFVAYTFITFNLVDMLHTIQYNFSVTFVCFIKEHISSGNLFYTVPVQKYMNTLVSSTWKTIFCRPDDIVFGRFHSKFLSRAYGKTIVNFLRFINQPITKCLCFTAILGGSLLHVSRSKPCPIRTSASSSPPPSLKTINY